MTVVFPWNLLENWTLFFYLQSQFEEQVKAVKTGSRLSELPDVQVSALPFPAWSSVSLSASLWREGNKAQ